MSGFFVFSVLLKAAQMSGQTPGMVEWTVATSSGRPPNRVGGLEILADVYLDSG